MKESFHCEFIIAILSFQIHSLCLKFARLIVEFGIVEIGIEEIGIVEVGIEIFSIEEIGIVVVGINQNFNHFSLKVSFDSCCSKNFVRLNFEILNFFILDAFLS